MPLKRTPPLNDSPASTAFNTPLQHYASESDVNDLIQEKVGFTSKTLFPGYSGTHKRKRDDDISKSEILELFSVYKQDQDKKFDNVLSTLIEVKTSLDQIHQKYDTALQRLDLLEEDKRNSCIKIQQLESKIEALERHIKGTSVELRNIPQIGKETKEDLRKIVQKTATALNISVSPSEIRDVYRVNNKANIKPIVAEFTTVFTRDNILQSLKKYNKDHQSDKFNTTCLGITGQSRPVYVSENLISSDRRLYFQAREFAQLNGYAFCWISFGRIFLRKKEGENQIRIRCESDLDNLKTN